MIILSEILPDAVKRTSGDYAAAWAEIAHAPAADVAPVVHGKWIVDKEGYGERIVHCSVCGKRSAENRYTSMEHGYSIECCYAIITDFCPNCGAKMDKEATP